MALPLQKLSSGLESSGVVLAERVSGELNTEILGNRPCQDFTNFQVDLHLISWFESV